MNLHIVVSAMCEDFREWPVDPGNVGIRSIRGDFWYRGEGRIAVYVGWSGLTLEHRRHDLDVPFQRGPGCGLRWALALGFQHLPETTRPLCMIQRNYPRRLSDHYTRKPFLPLQGYLLLWV